MVYVVLLLILAILLFGSSVVLGAIGYVLGFVAFLAAALIIGYTFSIHPILVMMGSIFGFIGLMGAVIVIAKILEPILEPWEQRRIERILAEAKPFAPKTNFPSLPEELQPAADRLYRQSQNSKRKD